MKLGKMKGADTHLETWLLAIRQTKIVNEHFYDLRLLIACDAKYTHVPDLRKIIKEWNIICKALASHLNIFIDRGTISD